MGKKQLKDPDISKGYMKKNKTTQKLQFDKTNEKSLATKTTTHPYS